MKESRKPGKYVGMGAGLGITYRVLMVHVIMLRKIVDC